MAEADGLQIDSMALRAMLDAGAAVGVLDVREPWETAICRIGASRNIPLAELADRCGELTEFAGDAPLVVVCHHGMRSLQATLWLRQQGFANAFNLAGGIDAWAQRVEPSMQRY
jgi:rhodanese-related sulfurtransferase